MKGKIVCLSAILILSISITGCKKEGELGIEDYKRMYNEKTTMLNNALDRNEALKRILFTYDDTLEEVKNLSDFTVLPSGEKAYIELNDKVHLSGDIDMSASLLVPNHTYISLSNNVRISPNSNWNFALGNGSTRMSHRMGVYGEVEVYEYIGESDAYNCYDTLLEPHLNAAQAQEVGKTVLFLDSRAGLMIDSRVKVVREKAVEELNELGSNLLGDIKESTAAPSEESSENSEGEGDSEENTETQESSENETTQGESDTIPSEVETDENGEVIEPVVEETTAEVDNTEIVNYRYVYGVVFSKKTSGAPTVLVFKFLYEEGSNNIAISELIESTLKSMSIDGSYISLQ